MGKVLSFPKWYSDRLVANPFFQPNAAMIMKEAYRMRDEYGVTDVREDKFRVLRIHIDLQPDFDWPLTIVDPVTGVVTRFLHPLFKGKVDIPKWWNEGQNVFVWTEKISIYDCISVLGGRLSVAGAWNDVRRITEFDMRWAHMITKHVLTADEHPYSARYDQHFYAARANNPYGLPVGAHPYAFMDKGEPFPKVTPKSLYHPEFNPDGWWEPLYFNKKDLDETWYYVNKAGVIYLWDMHCHSHTYGAIIEPIVMASTMHHAFMRGKLAAEPIIVGKGRTWRVDTLGAIAGEYDISSDKDPLVNATTNIFDICDGLPEQGLDDFHLIVIDGEADSHCELKSVQQLANQAEKKGRLDILKRIVVLSDCGSSIIGFEETAKEAWLKLERDYGIRRMKASELDLEREKKLALAA